MVRQMLQLVVVGHGRVEYAVWAAVPAACWLQPAPAVHYRPPTVPHRQKEGRVEEQEQCCIPELANSIGLGRSEEMEGYPMAWEGAELGCLATWRRRRLGGLRSAQPPSALPRMVPLISTLLLKAGSKSTGSSLHIFTCRCASRRSCSGGA